MCVALGIMYILMTLVIPKFKEVFQGLAEGADLPSFTRFVMSVSDLVKNHSFYTLIGLVTFVVASYASSRAPISGVGCG